MLRSTLAAGLTVLLTATLAHGAASIPDFGSATFVNGAPIDNPYFPLMPGTLYRYTGTIIDPDEPGESEMLAIEDLVTRDVEIVGGVRTTVVRAREWIDGLLVEDTRDFYAQDTAGNVWYFGEDTTAFEYDDDGNLVDTSNDGQWRAFENGALPGFIMPAYPPSVGSQYYQEYAPADDAVDQAEILALDETVTGPTGVFANVLKTLEFTELEPDVFEHKLYALGVGLVEIREDLDDEGVPLNVISLESITVVPTPAAVGPGMLALTWLLGVRRRRK